MTTDHPKKYHRRKPTLLSKVLLVLAVFCIAFFGSSFWDHQKSGGGLPSKLENKSITEANPTYNEQEKSSAAGENGAAEPANIESQTPAQKTETQQQAAGSDGSGQALVPGTGEAAVSVDTEQADATAYVAALASGEKEYPSKSKSGKICQNPQADKMVALTFDDGPNSVMTQKYLAILSKYDVPATFFVLGQYVLKSPEAAKAIVADGHEIGSHSWYHHNLPKKEDDFITKDFQKTTDIFQETLGQHPMLFRPPYGSIDDRVAAAATAQSMLTVFWSLDPEDWQAKDADTVVKKVTENVKSGDIILLHENRKVTLAALPEIIEKLQADGYQLVTVSRLLYEANQSDQ